MNNAIHQTAVLDALPAHIAVLDHQGLILQLNEPWHHFARLNMFADEKHGLGSNYLKICDHASGKDSFEACEVAEGVRSVLKANEPSFIIEYPCHSPTHKRWFLMTVTPLINEHQYGAVAMHFNITPRMENEARLSQLSLAMNGTTDAIYLVDRATLKFVHVNDAACRMNNKQSDELLKMVPWELNLTTRTELEFIYDGLIASGLPAKPIELLRRRLNGTRTWVEIRQQAELSGGGWKIIVVERDINERREAGIRLHRMAYYDELTGLPNRKHFYDSLSKAIKAGAGSNGLVSLLFLDLDYFKNVNDTLGHAIGDELLIQFSARLIQCIRVRDTVGRLGGDEFAIILAMEKSGFEPVIVANKIREMLKIPFNIGGHKLKVTASIGIASYPDDAVDMDTLINYADTAMYSAKNGGGDHYRFYTSCMNLDMQKVLV